MLSFRLIATIASLLLGPLTVRAGDMASVEVLGFSPDGSIFAFEEYGVQDGSGFPYANRYYIDTKSDSFLQGTPIRVRLDDGQVEVEAARREAENKGQAIISDDVLNQHTGFRAGWNPVTELSADPHRMMVNPRPVMPAVDAPVEFRLEELHLQQPADCENLGQTVGFRLLRVATVPTGKTETVQEDSSIPSSRGCPLGYRIAGIQTFHPQGAAPVFAVLIAIRRFGFEGPDHRFIAVTGDL